MSTLAVVEAVLRHAGEPLTVAEIVRRAGSRLPTRAKVPASVVARDLALDLKRNAEGSAFVRIGVGLYTLRELAPDAESLVVERSRRRWTWTEQARRREVRRRAQVASAAVDGGDVRRQELRRRVQAASAVEG